MSKFLIDESFIQVSVSLMLEIGQARAIVLQKLHSLTLKDKCYVATYQDWHKTISFISDEHLKRILVWLESKNLIIVKDKKDKRRKCYSLNFKTMSSQGFEIIESSVFHKNYLNKKMSFILPTLANLVGLTSAIFLQDFYYQNGENFSQMTKKDINKWVPYVGFRQVKILFYDLEIIEIIKSEFRDASSKNDGKYYSVNKLRIDQLLKVSIKKVDDLEQNHKRSRGVDNSMIVDNFNNLNHKRSPLKPQKIPPKTTIDPPHSIDQDQVRSFKDNNTNTLGRNDDCGIIPTMKDNIVSLKERLMTYGIDSYKIIELVHKFESERVEEVLREADLQSKKTGKPVSKNWVIKALELKWPFKQKQHVGIKVIGHTKPEESLERRYYLAKAELNAYNIKVMIEKRASNEVGECYLDVMRAKLGRKSVHI